MTKEEAIKGLKVLRRDFSGYKPNEEMFDIAIQALEQEQQRQEDIYECQYCFGEVHKNYIYCPFCGKRIEALEQEETSQNLTKPNKSDLISRQAAIDTVMGFMPSLTTPDGCGQFDREIFEAQEMFVDIGQALNKLPSAQPFTKEQIQTMQELEAAQVEKAYELGKADRPTGHWIETAQEYYETINEKGGGVDENTPYFTDDIACSECLAKFSVIDNETERFDFCPNCGADMRGGEEE